MPLSAISATRRPIVVALSGGVDSSVAAALVAGQGPATTAVHMSNWNTKQDDSREATDCSSDREYRDAQSVAQHLNIPIQRVRLESDYWVSVFEPYLQGITQASRRCSTTNNTWTGNPDVLCNRHVKFGALPELLRKEGNNDVTLVTGHYARLWRRNDKTAEQLALEEEVAAFCPSGSTMDWLQPWGGDASIPLLVSAVDDTKDQSYFLAASQGTAFRNVLFPLGDFKKNSSHNSRLSVRELAKQMDLPTAKKRESMGICFIGQKRRFADFVANYLEEPQHPVQFIDVDTGQRISETTSPAHASLYTTGQGAKISGTKSKYFCVESSSALENSVIVCTGTEHPALYSSWLILETVYWWTGVSPLSASTMRVHCRTRHLHALTPATLYYSTVDDVANDGGSNPKKQLRIVFDTPVRAVTPGQYAVLYIGVVCVGGGPIQATERPPAVRVIWEQQQQHAAAASKQHTSSIPA